MWFKNYNFKLIDEGVFLGQVVVVDKAPNYRKVIETFEKQAPGAHNLRRAKSRRFHGPVYS